MLSTVSSFLVHLLLLNAAIVASSSIWFCHAFSFDPGKIKNDSQEASSITGLSRREWFNVPIAVGGAVVYGKLLGDAGQKLVRGDMVYPADHENRVKSTIQTAVVSSLSNSFMDDKRNGDDLNDDKNRLGKAFRILEVGIGKDCRVIRRGLYEDALAQLSSRGVRSVEITGVDIAAPSKETIDSAAKVLLREVENMGVDVSFAISEGSLTSRLSFDDGFFDCVICTLTLCSVDDQIAALKEIKRVLNPQHGSFGYIEHVAVNDDEPYRLLNFQQQALDGLQQVVADNCHLHRYTEDNIYEIFGIATGGSVAVARERFLVDGMWPVSCQTCGVITRS